MRWKILNSFLFAVAVYSYQVFVTERVGTDDLEQIGTAVNFLEGHGFVRLHASADGEVITHKIYSWPYGLRILHVPLLLATSMDVERTILLSKVVGFLWLMLGVTSVILSTALPNKRAILCWIFLFAPFLYAPIRYMGAVDLLAVGTSLFSVAFAFRYFTQGQKIKYLLLFTVCVALLPHLRYAFIPQSALWILIFVTVFLLRGKRKPIHLFFLGIIMFGIYCATDNPYFYSRAGRSISQESAVNMVETTVLPIFRAYGAFFNALLPDFLLISTLKKVWPAMNADHVALLMGVFALISLFIMGYLAFRFLEKGRGLRNYCSDEKLLEFLILAVIIADLSFYLYLYRGIFYTPAQLMSEELSYRYLAVVNRYLAPIHTLTLLLFVIYRSHRPSVGLSVLMCIPVAFGGLHFAYQRVVLHPSVRNVNMDIMNEPPGSYGDVQVIGARIRELKSNHQVFYAHDFADGERRKRDVNPWKYAKANGVIILQQVEDVPSMILPDNSVYICSVLSERTGKLGEQWEVLYSGSVYSLLKAKYDAP